MFIIKTVKKLFFLIHGLFTYLFLALSAFAEASVTPPSVNPCANPEGIAKNLCALGGTGGGNIAKTIQNIVVFFIVLAVIIALLYLLYGGIKWITSRGDKTEVEAARNHIIAAIVGLIVVFLAVFILTIILVAFGLKLENLKIPTIAPNITPSP